MTGQYDVMTFDSLSEIAQAPCVMTGQYDVMTFLCGNTESANQVVCYRPIAV